MKALLVLAHPEPLSYNAALARSSCDALLSAGHDLKLSDLYSKGFCATEQGSRYAHRADPGRFDAQAEQRFSSGRGTLPVDVQAEISDLLWADAALFHFPLWWFGMPATLKGWMDRMFAYGEVYSGARRFGSGTCSGKLALLCVTAGSPAASLGHDGRKGTSSSTCGPSTRL